MNIMETTRKIQKALRYNYNIQTTITTTEYFNPKYGNYSHIYMLKRDRKQILSTPSKKKLLLQMVEILKEAEQNASIE